MTNENLPVEVTPEYETVFSVVEYEGLSFRILSPWIWELKRNVSDHSDLENVVLFKTIPLGPESLHDKDSRIVEVTTQDVRVKNLRGEWIYGPQRKSWEHITEEEFLELCIVWSEHKLLKEIGYELNIDFRSSPEGIQFFTKNISLEFKKHEQDTSLPYSFKITSLVQPLEEIVEKLENENSNEPKVPEARIFENCDFQTTPLVIEEVVSLMQINYFIIKYNLNKTHIFDDFLSGFSAKYGVGLTSYFNNLDY